MIFELAELEYKRQKYSLVLPEKSRAYAKKFAIQNKLPNKNLIGIHLGASSRWPSKKWDKTNLKEFIFKLNKNNFSTLLFGGENEIEEHLDFFNKLSKQGVKIYKNDSQNSLLEFASLVNLCDAMVCSDSMSLHISLSLNKPTIGLFFCTSPDEVEGYNGLLQKVVSPMLNKFFPERMNEYSLELTKSISSNEVFEVLSKLLKQKKVVNAIIKKGDKLLLIKRKNEEIHSGKWAFPGGIVEFGEDTFSALIREVKEEIDLIIKEPFIKISSYSYKRKDGKTTSGESYLIETFSGKVKINSESEDFGWFTLEEIEKLDKIENLEEEALIAFSK